MANSFYQILNSVADRGLELLALRRGRGLAGDILTLCHQLMSQRGEASGVALGREVAQTYLSLSDNDRLGFFRALADSFSPDAQQVIAAADRFRETRDPQSLLALSRAVESPRQKLFQRINLAPEGTATIIEMRRHLGKFLPDEPALRAVDEDLKIVLMSWFNRGFLVLQRIDWGTPAVILEKLIQYEAVHEIPGWDDLRRRLARDRQCFAFFHPAVKDDPVIFVQVALVKGMAADVQPLLSRDSPVGDPTEADTAIFYSITNCLDGLRGISFGNFLLKQVISDIQRELPNIRVFATLSPIPGFMRWLEEADPTILPARIAPHFDLARKVLAEEPWQEAPQRLEPARKALMVVCAHYLAVAKTGRHPRDPVAKFHLGNGARMERINWMGNTSAKGLAQSAGMLVNYLYRPQDIEKNHEAYADFGRVATGKQVESLLKG